MSIETWVDFKAVKAAVNIEMVLQRYGLFSRLTAKGDRLVGLCPVHHPAQVLRLRELMQPI